MLTKAMHWRVLLWACAMVLFVPDIRAQPQTFYFESTDGYNVTITLEPVSINRQNGSCSNMHYDVGVNYSIVFGGSNPPASLTTLGGFIGCDTEAPDYSESGLSGSGTFYTRRATRSSPPNCNPTPQQMGCDFISIDVTARNLNESSNSDQQGSGSSLPVELMNLEAVAGETRVELQWQTAMESDNESFSIERSPNGSLWKEIGTVRGAGNSRRVLDYSFADLSPLEGISYYRLKQTDFGGQFAYSGIITVRRGPVRPSVKVYPNPVQDILTIEGGDSFRLVDLYGRDYTTQTYTGKTGEAITRLDMSGLPAGIYLLQSGNYSEKIFKQ